MVFDVFRVVGVPTVLIYIVQFFNSSKDSMKTCESVRSTPRLLCVVRVWSSGECSELVTALVEMSFMLLTVSLPNNLISVLFPRL